MTEEKTTRKYAKLTPATWAKIRALWETGEPTLEELSARFSVTTRALQSHFKKHKTIKGEKAKEIAAAVREAIYSDYLDDREAVIAKAKECRAAAFSRAETIETLIMGQITAAQKEPAAAFKASAAIKTLALAAQALERTQAIKTSALGLDRLESAMELPKIVIEDLSEAEIEQLRRKHEEDDSELWIDDADEVVG